MWIKNSRFGYACLVLAALVSTGCGREADPVDEPQLDAETQAADQRALEPVRPTLPAVDQVANSLTSEGAQLRYDRTAPTPDGASQERQVYLEMIGTGVDDSTRAAKEVLARNGYEEIRRSGDAEDVHLVFSQEGAPEVKLRVRSREAHPNLKSPDALSSVYVTYEL